MTTDEDPSTATEKLADLRSSALKWWDDYSFRYAHAVATIFLAILVVSGSGVAWAPTADADSDGLSNIEEWTDGKPTKWKDADVDGDGLEDGREVKSAQFNVSKADTDGDGLNDSEELEFGSNATLSDTDGDGLLDPRERKVGTNPTKIDTDSDGLNDYNETEVGTNPTISDTDQDGLSDGKEVTIGSDPKRPDTDGDSLLDPAELKHNTSFQSADTDDDGLGDYEEVQEFNSNPTKVDTDSDGLEDAIEVKSETLVNVSDTDDDGLEDGAEVQNGTSPVTADSDNDGLEDGEELKQYSTDPLHPDTDQDNVTDGAEVAEYGTDPTLNDTDGDGLLDGEEVNIYETDPLSNDTDSDNVSDAVEVRTEGISPLQNDSDGDGLSDGAELYKYETDPASQDTDSDSMYDSEEINLSAYSAVEADPIRGMYEEQNISEETTASLNEIFSELSNSAETLATDNPNATFLEEYAAFLRSLPDFEGTGTGVTLLENARQAGLYEALSRLSSEMGIAIPATAFRTRLRQGIRVGERLNGLTSVANDYSRLQKQADRLNDSDPTNGEAAKTAMLIATAVLLVDTVLVVKTGGTIGLPSSQIAFSLTGTFAAKTGLARLVNFCSWKCVGSVERFIHWTIRVGLDLIESEAIAQLIKIAYHIPQLALETVVEGLLSFDIVQDLAKFLTTDVMKVLAEILGIPLPEYSQTPIRTNPLRCA